MTAGMAMAGLSPEQGPPLSITASFLATAPLGIVAAGALLLFEGPAALVSRWLPATIALTHLGTLGVLGVTMLGSLYQMTPVVAGVPVGALRLAHAVHVLFVLGVAALVAWLLGAGPHAGHIAAGALGASAALFLVPIAVALARAATKSDTVTGMRLALFAFALTVALGLVLVATRLGWMSPASWATVLGAHLTVGLVGWIGGLIGAVSWQILPMFYLALEVPRPARLASLGASAVLGVAAIGLVLLGADPRWVVWAAAPAALCAWALHPLFALRQLRHRRRKRADASLAFWQAGLALGPVTLLFAVGAYLSDDPRLPLAFAWTALFGWAGLIVHGMLTRIVPFLVWFHRFAALVGKAPVPAMRQLWPDGIIRVGLGLHVAALAAGLATLSTGSAWLARITGGLLATTGAWLFVSLVRVLLARAPRLSASP